MPPSISYQYVLKSIKSRLAFWKLIDSHVKENTPFPPLNLFRHGCQAFYAKTKGGVDGSAQARAIFRSTTSSFKWEPKIMSQTLKTLTVNAFISWRMTRNKHLLETKENFQSLDSFRSALKNTQSLSYFALDAAIELLAHADEVEKSGILSNNSVDTVPFEEA
jgi:hypothetical protein